MSSLVDRIYEAALLPELWSDLLHDMSVQHGFEGGVLFTVNAMSQRGAFSPGVEAVFAAFLQNGWATKSERAFRTIAKRHPGFIRDEDLFTVEELEADPLHVELLRPFGLGDIAGTVIDCPNGDRMALSFERALHLGRTPDAVIASFDALRPHLARASMIAGRLEIEKANAQVAALGAFGLPSAVLTATGRVLAENDRLAALSSQIDIRAGDVFTPRDPGAAKLFRQVVMQAGATELVSGRSIPLPGTETARGGVLHLLPIRRNANDIFPGANWLVAITALGGSVPPSMSILSGLFDLTPAEARVASAVLEGLTLNEIAARHRLSLATVRNQLSAVFSKTGVARQSDFILLCGGLHLPAG